MCGRSLNKTCIIKFANDAKDYNVNPQTCICFCLMKTVYNGYKKLGK